MSDTPVPPHQTSSPEPAESGEPGVDVVVDLAAFLPEGVVLAEPAGGDADPDEGAAEDEAGTEAAGDGEPRASDRELPAAWLADFEPFEPVSSEADPDVARSLDHPGDDEQGGDRHPSAADPTLDPGTGVEPEAGPEGPARLPVDVAALEQVERDLGAVDAALRALDQGTYGSCPSCGTPVADEVLAADPTTLSCTVHPAAVPAAAPAAPAL